MSFSVTNDEESQLTEALLLVKVSGLCRASDILAVAFWKVWNNEAAFKRKFYPKPPFDGGYDQ